MDMIKINNLKVFAHHGVYPEENKLGQVFEISVKAYLDLKNAGLSDDIYLSVSYGEIARCCDRFVREHTYKLLESVAENLAEELFYTFPLISELEIEVSKPNAPINLSFNTVSVCIQRKWHSSYIALGSNLGDKVNYLNEAVRLLDGFKDIRIINQSDYIVTKPYGGVEQDDFVNAVIYIETLKSPNELLNTLLDIEKKAGRERTIHWGPRTLDLDIIFYDDLIIHQEELTVPHIDMHNREFVLKPMVQINPYAMHPVFNKSVLQLLNELNEHS